MGYQHRHQRGHGRDVHPVNPLQQHLVIEKTNQEHAPDAAHNPVQLLDVRAGKFRVLGGTVDLHDPQTTDDQDEYEEYPIKIAE